MINVLNISFPEVINLEFFISVFFLFIFFLPIDIYKEKYIIWAVHTSLPNSLDGCYNFVSVEKII